MRVRCDSFVLPLAKRDNLMSQINVTQVERLGPTVVVTPPVVSKFWYREMYRIGLRVLRVAGFFGVRLGLRNFGWQPGVQDLDQIARG